LVYPFNYVVYLCCCCGYIVETEKGIFNEIIKGEIDFDSQPWPSISESAKDLVRKLLTKDPKQRISAAQALGKVTLVSLSAVL